MIKAKEDLPTIFRRNVLKNVAQLAKIQITRISDKDCRKNSKAKLLSNQKNFIRKILVDDTVFEFKNFSYIKAFFNNIVSSAEIKATSEVTKKVLVYVPFICSIYCTENKSKLKKAKSKVLRKAMQKSVKGIKMSNKNETLYV